VVRAELACPVVVPRGRQDRCRAASGGRTPRRVT
jgi:hypothetical protein